MTDIIKRLKEATGPDRELDCDIAISLDFIATREYWSYDYAQTVAHYTASIDAALALVERMLPGWYYTITSHNTSMGNKPWCDLATHEYIHGDVLVEGVYFESAGPTIPLAILTALFTALEAKAHD